MLSAFWVVVVQADRPDVLRRLRRLLVDAPWAEVVVDRRRAERRRSDSPVVLTPVAERRRGERRGVSPRATDSRYRLIESGDGYQVLQNAGRATARCTECGTAVEFDMAYLPELPVQLEISVFHPGRGGTARHVVETQARRASGRPFLASRILARRRLVAG